MPHALLLLSTCLTEEQHMSVPSRTLILNTTAFAFVKEWTDLQQSQTQTTPTQQGKRPPLQIDNGSPSGGWHSSLSRAWLFRQAI